MAITACIQQSVSTQILIYRLKNKKKKEIRRQAASRTTIQMLLTKCSCLHSLNNSVSGRENTARIFCPSRSLSLFSSSFFSLSFSILLARTHLDHRHLNVAEKKIYAMLDTQCSNVERSSLVYDQRHTYRAHSGCPNMHSNGWIKRLLFIVQFVQLRNMLCIWR